ncbi:MAG: DNA/RNA helicase domain-containing protein [Thermodesulfobacteriota bacterium]
MIIYSSNKSDFRKDVKDNRIEELIYEAYFRNLGCSTSKSEVNSWKNSMMYMSNVLEDEAIPDNVGIAIEYKIPQTSKRVDIIVTGLNVKALKTAVIIELKQWSEASATEKDGIVKTFLNGAQREVTHPSYQAWTYSALLSDFNETVQKEHISLNPCAYLHNMKSDTAIKDFRYNYHIKKAPSFVRKDAQKLTNFIKEFIRYGDNGKLIYEIDNGKIRPSKNLAESILSMLKGNEEFLMIDDQKLVFEKALDTAKKASIKNKKVLIVEGGPGTGKSVVAVNLLVKLTNERLLCQYVTKNAAPRAVYESMLTGSFKKSHISNLFKGSGSFTKTDSNIFDALIVDEAHRLNEKSGLFQNQGENQIKEIINSSKFSIFFTDDNQKVTWKDIGEKKLIEQWADTFNAEVFNMKLESQFRCNGSDGYLAWLDNALNINNTTNETLNNINFDFKVFKSPVDLKKAIFEKNRINNKSRIVAGYCWDWISKKVENKDKMDICFPEFDFEMQWNLTEHNNLWIKESESINQVGCIHTCQGLELDYVGVIIGQDLIVRNGEIITNPEARAKTDQSLRGYKKALKDDRKKTLEKASAIIKNTYRTLMTRGQKGCYIYCTDPETNEYFFNLSSCILDSHYEFKDENKPLNENILTNEKYPGLNLKVLEHKEVNPYENSVPIYNMEIAAGNFNYEVYNEDFDWVELPEEFRIREGLFVARVAGESMNRRIPNGAWCLFKANPSGSRNNKIVIVQHKDIFDQDTGSSYTIKIYKSEKIFFSDESWEHSKIILKPDSTFDNYNDIIFENIPEEDLQVIGEFIAVIS